MLQDMRHPIPPFLGNECDMFYSCHKSARVCGGSLADSQEQKNAVLHQDGEISEICLSSRLTHRDSLPTIPSHRGSPTRLADPQCGPFLMLIERLEKSGQGASNF